MPLKIGSVLRSRYHVQSVLGRGGMGAVYRAIDSNLGVPVAVKENLFTSEEYARQFRREANILASLRHPNLPRVTDHFVIEGQGQYLVMDFIEGEDLRQRLERDGAADESVVLEWFLEVADALAYLHSRNPPILHRDVKPGNIKLTPEGRAILVDFGLAKVWGEAGSTTTGAKAMTPGFSPPEQYGTGRSDPRTDVYSMGATMYAALTAEIPEDSLERAMGRAELSPVRKRNPAVSPLVAQVVERSLGVRPEERYQNTREFAAALRTARGSGVATLARPYPYLERTRVRAGKIVVGGGIPISRAKPVRTSQVPRVVLGLAVVGAVAGVSLLTLPALGSILGTNPQASPTGGPAATATRLAGRGTEARGNLTATTVIVTPTIEGRAELSLTPAPTPVGGGVGQIAFASNRGGVTQIYLVNIDGTGLQQLTRNQDGACQPSWSPDGQRLAFTSPCRRNQETYPGAGLWVMALDGTELKPLPTVPGGDFDPAWAPDGLRIAFTSLRNGRGQVMIYNLETAEVKEVSGRYDYDSQPAWAPDGNQLAFVSIRTGDPQLWFMPALGGEDERLTRGSNEDSFPDWSHDGARVLFQRQLGGIPRLFSIRYEDRGAVAQQVCPQGPLAGKPMAEAGWAPDGFWIVMETWPTGSNHEVAIMTTTCTNFTTLAGDPAADFDPAWRP